ncbi:2'-5' RNA ligase family protein [Paraburkholderia sp. PREW-6R]|uniref:2'-5' RNA ligase family protein n=1 Tax=Paraburkholderia sp. PREW-6R TaxID=3141544 RepID=UPI0031F5616E
MPEQLWLPGLEAPPVPTDGLFFAVYPNAATAAGIAKLAQQLREQSRSRSKPLAANRLHVTLHHLGNFVGGLPGPKVDAAMSAAAAAAAAIAPFSVEFDRVVSFASKPRPGPLVLCGGEGAAGLHVLHDILGQALDQAGFERHAARESVPYTPHVTLAYGMPWIDERTVEAFAWNVREVVLMHSLLGRSRHVALGRWPLAASG